MQAVMKIGVRATDICESGQAWKGAAISRFACVPQGSPDRAGYISNAYVTVSIRGARFTYE